MAASKMKELQRLLIEKLEKLRDHKVPHSTSYYEPRERSQYVIFESLVTVKATPPEDNEDIRWYASRLSSLIYDVGGVSDTYRKQTKNATMSVMCALSEAYYKVTGEKWPYVID